MEMKGLVCARLGLLTCVVCVAASASLIQDMSYQPQTGSGIGNVLTLLSIQANHRNATESGCVSWNGTADVLGSCTTGIAGGDEKTGASQTLTRTLSEAGITSPDQIRIVFNVNQPGGTGITLENLLMTV